MTYKYEIYRNAREINAERINNSYRCEANVLNIIRLINGNRAG